MSKAEKNANWQGKRVRFADAVVELAQRRSEVEVPDSPRNSGDRRTPSKRALLKAIKEAGGKW